MSKWREKNYPGVTGATKKLLQHWHAGTIRDTPFFFCQLEAIETLIWITGAPEADRVGINIKNDGGDFNRFCAKMATGTGKTVVMGMLIAWQIINKVLYPKDVRFSRYILIIAPSLTVKERLSVLCPGKRSNYFVIFDIVPASMREQLFQGRILIHNWHVLAWDSGEKLAKKSSVDKRGVKSDEAYTKEVCAEFGHAKNIIVINDEAHHAWRVPPKIKKGTAAKEAEQATIWIGGLDRIHRARGILRCFDFSATPFVPSIKQNIEEALFEWIVSDFSLNDAIESGLVKTPRIVVRDGVIPNLELFKSKLYHLYMNDDVKDNLNRSNIKPHDPLPELVINAYLLLGEDWRLTKIRWDKIGHKVPPVMITVTNRTETAERIEYVFEHNKIPIPQLCDSRKILRIDSKILSEAESVGDTAQIVEQDANTKKQTLKERAELLRRKVNTVGQVGEPGGEIQHVICCCYVV